MGKNARSIAVIGCGWLGIPFCRKMIERGWTVYGTTTNKAKFPVLKNFGIRPFLLNLPSKTELNSNLFKVDYLLINLPPGRRNPNILENYPLAISQILSSAKKMLTIKKIIFISSTSIYGISKDLIDEKTNPRPESDSGRAILAAENLIAKCDLPNVILRFGGLAGPQRHPGRFLAGRSGLTSGKQSINFLHLEDAIGVINYMIDNNIASEVFNVVAPGHPTKKEFYTKMASAIELTPPSFIDTPNQTRREISVNKLLNETEYSFEYPDPMNFIY